MATRKDRSRSRLLAALSGTHDGRPAWVDRIEEGDDAGFFGPGSAAWAVHGGMPTLVAGIRALLVQTLHPGAMAGVHDHSRFGEDPLGRLAGTIQWLTIVTYADTVFATEESARVGKYHSRVVGTYLDAHDVERPYAAGDPELLAWVHLAFTDSFLACHTIWGGVIPGGADAYVREWATAGELVGVESPPRSEQQLREQLAAFSDDGILKSDERVAEAVRFIRHPPLPKPMLPAYRVLFAGAVASLPEDYRRMLGLRRSRLPVVWATARVLGAVHSLLGRRSPSEDAARARIARIRKGGAADPGSPQQARTTAD